MIIAILIYGAIAGVFTSAFFLVFVKMLFDEYAAAKNEEI
jgi:hypothetical protein